jgi:superfamily II DNA or RNA helicase
MELRDYQVETIDELRNRLRSGKRRPVVQAPTGAGKTVMAAAIVKMARANNAKVLFVVPALSLIDQTVERFQQNGIDEIGVIQASHELTDYRKPVQVASVQTLMRRDFGMFDLVIIDECHVSFKFYHDWFAKDDWKRVPIIGLTATPWAKGMGRLWDDLLICTTTAKLIEDGFLSDFRVFAPAHPDLSSVKTVAGDYEVSGLATAMNKDKLVADIVSTWLERADNQPTLCFAVNRLHAKHLQKQFEEAGVRTEYLDAFSDLDDRNRVAALFANGEVKVVCNVGVLTTGVDWDVRCIVLARPTKSEILYTQIIGRGLRKAEGKKDLLILDHSDTTLKLGFVDTIHHDTLDDGLPKRAAPKQAEKLPKECPKCSFLRPAKVVICPNCGFKAEAINKVEAADGQLLELNRKNKTKAKNIGSLKGAEWFYRELLMYSDQHGYKGGWAYYAFKDKFGFPPPRVFSTEPMEVSPATLSWIKHRNIRNAKRRQNG